MYSTPPSKNLQAFLDMIADSEIGQDLLSESDNGYNILVGSTVEEPLVFDDYSDHPRIYNHDFHSTAAGRYQELAKNYDAYAATLGLSDFSPASQDAIAIQQIKETHALPDIEAGHIEYAIAKTAHLWASFPGAMYGQHENRIAELLQAFTDAGGTLA